MSEPEVWLKPPIRCVIIVAPKRCDCCPRNTQTFSDVKPGTKGSIVRIRFRDTPSELWGVRLDDGIFHFYRPREIGLLD